MCTLQVKMDPCIYRIKAIAPCAPLTYLKRRHSIVSYVQSVIHINNFLLKRAPTIKVATMKIKSSITSGSHHKIDTLLVSTDEWDTKENPVKSMKNALYAQWHGKRHLSGWSDIKNNNNQAFNLSHCGVS